MICQVGFRLIDYVRFRFDMTEKLIATITNQATDFARVVVVINHKSRWLHSTHLTQTLGSLYHFQIDRSADLVRLTNVVDVVTRLTVSAQTVWSWTLIELSASLRDAT